MSWRRNPDKPRASAGFMLLEALVAVGVAAVLLAVLMQAFSSVWRGIGAVREETEAMLVARAVIEASTPRLNLAPMTQEGTTGRYVWSMGIVSTQLQSAVADSGQPQPAQPASSPNTGKQPLDTQDSEQSANAPEATQPWTLFRIAVSVRAPSGRRTTLETYRLSRPTR